MKVAVIIPVFNCQAFLPAALGSVRVQTRAPDEILVVDDGSTDGAPAWLAAQADLRVITQSNRGAGAARNAAVKATDAAVLAFLDTDDLWRPTHIEQHLAHLRADPLLEAVFGRVEQFHDGQVRREQYDGYIPSAMVIRRDAFLRVGWFDETPGLPEFANWFLRARECGLKHTVGEQISAERRIHAGNKGRHAGTGRQYLMALKASLDRRRAERN